MKRLTILLLYFLLVSSAAAQTKLKVVSTIGMIGDIVEQIGGESIEHATLIPSGVDPHLYKPTRSDIAKLSKADVVFYNGLFLEGKMVDAFKRLEKAGKRVVALAETVDRTMLIEPEDYSGSYDPHIWMDPLLWSNAASKAAETLSVIKMEDSEVFRTNLGIVLNKLRVLHQYSVQTLKTIPEGSRVLVTAHDAFGYFGKRYNFEVVGIQGISTESETGVKDLEKVIDLITTRKVKAVFVESTISKKSVEALLEGAEARGHKLSIGGELFSDAMGKPGTKEGTYTGMIEHNIKTISSALSGS